MAVIEIDTLSYTYPACDVPALNELTLKVEPNQIVAIIGVNNAGKTSLCHALTGVIPNLLHGNIEGSVRICDQDTNSKSISELAASIAFVMQNPEAQLSGVRFSVREEVAFGLENCGMDREAMQSRVDEALRLAGISSLADRSPHHLSGGQLQKVALASAIAMDTPVLVLDEPTTSLDPVSAVATYEILQELKSRGKTIVVAEQRLHNVAEYADRVVALHKGRIALEGPTREVLTSPVIRDIGLDWLRFTKIGSGATTRGLWGNGASLPITLDDTVSGLSKEPGKS